MTSAPALLTLIAVLLFQALACRGCTPSVDRRCDEAASSWKDLFSEERLEAWLWSLIGSVLVGLSGVLPLLVIPIEAGATLKSEGGSQRLKQLLSFAIGGLLGDVFLHLLPEAWAYTCSATIGGGQTLQQQKLLGLWVITGFLTFLVLEKMFPDEVSRTEWRELVMVTEGSHKVTCSNHNSHQKAEINGKYTAGSALNCKAGYSAPSMDRKADRAKGIDTGGAGDCKAGYSVPSMEHKVDQAKVIHAGFACDYKAGYSAPSMDRKAGQTEVIYADCAGDCKCVCTHTSGDGFSRSLQQVTNKIKMSGYLNLLANTIDNFTHGMAVAGSFLVSKKVGFLTTFAILLHEIPHEVGDFAILLRAGFDRWSAAKMQVTTALGGILGACFAICMQSPKGAGETVAWILPFTSGGFLYIALVNVVPELLEEKNIWCSVLQVCLLCCGVLVMMLLSLSVG